jgi:hypothetical protein
VKVFVICWFLFPSQIVQSRVSLVQPGTVETNRRTARPKCVVGQSLWLPVRRWERESILIPFFWSSKVTVRYSATCTRRGCVCGITRMHLSRKTK